MSRVLSVSPELDHQAFEALVAELPDAARSGVSILFDASAVTWVSPYGLIGLLALGREVEQRTGKRPMLEPPRNREVSGYMERMEFWPAAQNVFQLPGKQARRHGDSGALIEITSIRSNEDVHAVVKKVGQGARRILQGRLGYSKASVIHFSIMLSEVCQNIVEHAGSLGWACAQTYRWQRRLGREVAVLAVMDVGIGFEQSLGARKASTGSAAALEAAVLRGESRFKDRGRGHGLQAIRRQVLEWHGSLRIRSGTAMVGDIAEWERRLAAGAGGEYAPDRVSVKTGLPPFPGAQVMIVLPAAEESITPGPEAA